MPPQPLKYTPWYTCVHGLIGLDYVSHDDILPYTSTSQDPFQHELFDQFLTLESKDEGACIIIIVVLCVHPLETDFLMCC